MKNFKYMLLIAVAAILAGCCSDPEIREVIVYKPKEVYVQQPCDVEVKCEFGGEGYVPTSKLVQCIIEQKKALEYCKQTNTGS